MSQPTITEPPPESPPPRRTEAELQESRKRGGRRGALSRWGLRKLPPIEDDEDWLALGY